MHTWLILSTVALAFWGITGVTQKLSTNHISFERSFLWFSLAFFGQAAVIAAVLHLHWHVPLPLVALAAFGGLLNGLGALTSFAALERGGKASVAVRRSAPPPSLAGRGGGGVAAVFWGFLFFFPSSNRPPVNRINKSRHRGRS